MTTEAEQLAAAQAHARLAEREAIAAQVRLDIITAQFAAHESAHLLGSDWAQKVLIGAVQTH